MNNNELVIKEIEARLNRISFLESMLKDLSPLIKKKPGFYFLESYYTLKKEYETLSGKSWKP